MSHSIQKRLSRTLALAIISTGLIATVVSYGLALIDAQRIQDTSLSEMATLAASHAAELTTATGTNAMPYPMHLAGRIVIFNLPHDARPAWLPADLRAGLQTLSGETEPMRVFVSDTEPGKQIVVTQPIDVRDDLAEDRTISTLIPLFFLLPLLVWLATKLILRELAPVKKLATYLDEQLAERPSPLPVTDIPDEITSFVRAINRLLERVGRLIDQQRRFIADAAHELRSPLAALSIQAQNLENADSLQVMHERVLPLKAGINYARQLTEQLLSLAKTQACTELATIVDLSKIADELITDALPIAESMGIHLRLDAVSHLTTLTSIETLKLILKNALENALSYTPPQGTVTLRIFQEVSDVVIEIIDSGPGIPLAERQRVFDPFYRIVGSASIGSGLGLAIAKDAASRLGGAVSLHDRTDGIGLVFMYRQRRITNTD